MRIWARKTRWIVALGVSVSTALLPPMRAAGPAGPTVTGPIAATVAVGDAAHDSTGRSSSSGIT